MEEDIIYLAGFFDGEGYCAFLNHDGVYNIIVVTLTQKDRRVLDWLQQHYGGRIQRDSTGVHRWTRRGAAAAQLLEWLRPYLKVKMEQVDRVLTAWYGRPRQKQSREAYALSSKRSVWT